MCLTNGSVLQVGSGVRFAQSQVGVLNGSSLSRSAVSKQPGLLVIGPELLKTTDAVVCLPWFRVVDAMSRGAAQGLVARPRTFLEGGTFFWSGMLGLRRNGLGRDVLGRGNVLWPRKNFCGGGGNVPDHKEMPERAMRHREGSVLARGHFFAAVHGGPAGLFHGAESAVHERASDKVDWRRIGCGEVKQLG